MYLGCAYISEQSEFKYFKIKKGAIVVNPFRELTLIGLKVDL
jgi:hypothetical protein